MIMNEYQINVSLNGKFLFRTDWDNDKERAYAAGVILRTSLPLAKVTMTSRCLAQEVVEDFYKQ